MTPTDTQSRTALLGTILAMVQPSGTAAEVDDRLEAAGVTALPGVVAGALDELATMGLVRAAGAAESSLRYVPTTLGQQQLDAGLTGEAAARLRDLESLRTDLLSTIAHELRTPLTAIRTNIGLLLDPETHPSDEQRRAMLEAIERNGQRMQRLVGDVLDLSRFRSGRIGLQLRRFNANELAEAAIAVATPVATRRGQVGRLDRRAGADHRVYGDHRRLEQALLNLVMNAHRFAPDGGTVTVSVDVRDHDTAWSVTDDGPGIPADDMGRLFERFFVGRNDRNGPREGVGLGLPIALAIAQAHGGSIEVDSEPGRGSTFTLVVPTAGPRDEP